MHVRLETYLAFGLEPPRSLHRGLELFPLLLRQTFHLFIPFLDLHPSRGLEGGLGLEASEGRRVELLVRFGNLGLRLGFGAKIDRRLRLMRLGFGHRFRGRGFGFDRAQLALPEGHHLALHVGSVRKAGGKSKLK